MKRSKAYRAAAEKIDATSSTRPSRPSGLAKRRSPAKFDATVEVAMRLGVDPRKADQMVRGTVNLPHGTGKTAGSSSSPPVRRPRRRGGRRRHRRLDELIEKVGAATSRLRRRRRDPDLMGKVGRLGRVLGPRGLMPNPKTGTVTMDVAKAVTDIKGGKIEFRVDKHANLHFIIGKASFTDELVENYAPRSTRSCGSSRRHVQGPLPQEDRGRHDHGPRRPGRPAAQARRGHRLISGTHLRPRTPLGCGAAVRPPRVWPCTARGEDLAGFRALVSTW
jgi:large subunit ribosomal protein L1